MLFHVMHAMSEGRLSPSIFCSLHVMYDLDLLLNDKGRYIYLMNKYNVLQLKPQSLKQFNLFLMHWLITILQSKV